MSAAPWQPSPQLARAVQQALLTFQRHYPRLFALAGDSSDAGQAFLADYARAFVGRSIHLDVIPDAAQRWIAEKDDPPRPASFVAWCRTIEQVYPQLAARTASPAPVPEAYDGAKDLRGIEKRSVYMREALGPKLGTLTNVALCWALLLEMAGSDEERQRVHLGLSDSVEVDVVVQLFREGRRPHGGPLSTTLTQAVA